MTLLRKIRKAASGIVVGAHKKYLRYGGVTIGEGGLVSPFAQVDVTRGSVMIGDGVYITAGCRILSHSTIEGRLHPDRDPRTETVIEDDVFIGVNSVVLPGVTIGEGSIVGAGSVVAEDVEPHTVVAGNPAEKIKDVPTTDD